MGLSLSLLSRLRSDGRGTSLSKCLERLFPCVIWQRSRGSAAPIVASPLALRVLPPSQDQIVDMLLSVNPGQAIGEDSVPASVGRTCPQAFARILTPLFQKTCSLGLWPLRWKGRKCDFAAQTVSASAPVQVKSRHPGQ